MVTDAVNAGYFVSLACRAASPRYAVNECKSESSWPCASDVGDGVDERHVCTSDRRVTDLCVESNRSNKHCSRSHLNVNRIVLILSMSHDQKSSLAKAGL